MATSSWFQGVLDQVASITKQPPKTKAENIARYQELYPAKAKPKKKGQAAVPSWKQKIVKDLAQITGLKEKNLEKRFDTQRRGNPEPRNAAQYKELGEQFPPLPPPHGYRVDFDGWISFSQCEKRKFIVDITGKFAQAIALDNGLLTKAMLLIYMEEEDEGTPLEDQDASVGICIEGQQNGVNDPKITVSAAPKGARQGHLTAAGGTAQKRRFSFFGR